MLERVAKTNPRRRMRELLKRDGLVRAPGVIDPLSAKLVEEAGFEAVYVTGGGISRSMGFPDVGVVTMTEMLDRVRLITSAASIPAIVDIDTGYGNAINLIRAVRCFEAAGVAAVHIEDQVTPKRCGHYTGKALVPTEEMTLKLKAAQEARSDPDLVLIARTDARAVEGVEAAIARARAYVEAGADMIFFEAPESFEEMEAVAKAIKVPLLLNMFGGGNTPAVAIKDLQRIGYRVVIFPSHLQRASIRAMQKALELLQREDLTDGEDSDLMITFKERERIVGLKEIRELEDCFLTLKTDGAGT